MLSQSLALVRAMDIDADDIRAIPTPLLRSFPTLARIPGWQLTLGREPDWLKRKLYPDLLITTGRRMAGISIGIRRRSAYRTKTIHIQDSRLPAHLFDLCIVPQHDPLARLADKPAPHDNIIVSTGSLNRIRPEDISEAAVADSAHSAWPKHRFIAVMIGGASRSGRMNPQQLKQFSHHLGVLAQQTQAELMLIPSRRTGADVIHTLTRHLENHSPSVPFSLTQDRQENPYLYALGRAEMIVVTADSVNMTTEACITGKPVFTAAITPLSTRLQAFHSHMQHLGHTQSLDIVMNAQRWNPQPPKLDEMHQIAEQVYARLTPDEQAAP